MLKNLIVGSLLKKLQMLGTRSSNDADAAFSADWWRTKVDYVCVEPQGTAL